MRFAIRLPNWAYWSLVAILISFVIFIVFYIFKNKGIKRNMFAFPYTLWMVMFTVVPIVLVIYYALTDVNGKVTFDNFRNFWDSNYDKNKLYATMGEEYKILVRRGSVNIDTLLYSLWMAFLCTIVCLAVGYPAAMIMADKKLNIGATIVVLFIIPMWMNFLLRTIAWMSLLEDQGLINTLLKSMGFEGLHLMYNDGAVLFGMIYNFLPFMVFPIYTSLNKLDFRLREAAQDLGANNIKTFLRVILPLSLPGVISGITMVFMPAVTTFFIPRILGGGNTMMFGDLIEAKFLTEGNWNVGSALSLIMMVLILLSLGILRKADPEGEGGSMI